MVVSRLRDSHKFDFRDGVHINFKYMSFVDCEKVMDLADTTAALSDKIFRFTEQFNPGGA